MFRITIITIFLICHYNTNHAQVLKHYKDFDLEWGELFRSSGNVSSLLQTNDGNYYSLVNKTNVYNFFIDYKKRFYLEPIVDFKPKLRQKIKLYGDDKRSTLEDITVLDNQLLVVSKNSRFLKKETRFYYHFINPDFIGEDTRGFPLGKYKYSRARNGFGYISLINNLSQDLAGIFYTVPSEGYDFPRYAFGILDGSQEMLYSNENAFPYRNKKLNFFDQHLSSSGDLFVLARESNNVNNFQWRHENNPEQIRVFKVEDGELIDFKVNQSEFILSEINVVSSDQGELIFSGLYSEDEFSGIRGIFFIKMDTTGKTKTKKFHEFSTNFMLSGKSEWMRNSAKKTNYLGQVVEGLGNFKMQDLQKTADNGYVGVAEHFEIEKRFSGAGTPGTTNRTDTYFFFDDIIVYKLDSVGALEWVKRIPKSQNSINDGGYYLSIVQALSSDFLYILFNDNTKNYDDDNFYLGLESPKSASFNFRKNTIAMAKINLKDGSINRFALGGKNEMSTVLVPKLCIENRENNELFLYSRSSKRQRYGKLFINN